jgi:hypothetical protein
MAESLESLIMRYTYGNAVNSLDPAASDKRTLTDDNIGPLLVAWLWMTTTPKWQPAGPDGPLSKEGVALAAHLNLTENTLLSVQRQVLADPDSFAGVAAALQTLVGNGGYTQGPVCLSSLKPLLSLKTQIPDPPAIPGE